MNGLHIYNNNQVLVLLPRPTCFQVVEGMRLASFSADTYLMTSRLVAGLSTTAVDVGGGAPETDSKLDEVEMGLDK